MAFENMGAMMKLMGAWNKFKSNHPKFPGFINAVQKRGLHEDMVVEIIVTEPDGEKIETSLKIKQSDLEILSELKSVKP